MKNYEREVRVYVLLGSQLLGGCRRLRQRLRHRRHRHRHRHRHRDVVSGPPKTVKKITI